MEPKEPLKPIEELIAYFILFQSIWPVLMSILSGGVGNLVPVVIYSLIAVGAGVGILLRKRWAVMLYWVICAISIFEIVMIDLSLPRSQWIFAALNIAAATYLSVLEKRKTKREEIKIEDVELTDKPPMPRVEDVERRVDRTNITKVIFADILGICFFATQVISIFLFQIMESIAPMQPLIGYAILSSIGMAVIFRRFSGEWAPMAMGMRYIAIGSLVIEIPLIVSMNMVRSSSVGYFIDPRGFIFVGALICAVVIGIFAGVFCKILKVRQTRKDSAK